MNFCGFHILKTTKVPKGVTFVFCHFCYLCVLCSPLENCNYIGHLVNETEACVAMTGCPGQDDLQFTILSLSLDSPMYVWKKDGSVEVIEKPSNLRAVEEPKVDDDIVIDDPEEMAKEFIIEEFCWFGWG